MNENGTRMTPLLPQSLRTAAPTTPPPARPPGTTALALGVPLSKEVLSKKPSWLVEFAWAAALGMLSGGLLGVCWMPEPSLATAACGTVLWALILGASARSSPVVGAVVCFLSGLAARSVAFQWVPDVVAESFQVSQPVAYLFFLFMIAFESLGWLLIGALASWTLQRRAISVYAIPAAVVVLDWVWPRVFPWSMGHLWIGCSPLIQIADVGGLLAITWLMTGTACALVLLFEWRLALRSRSIVEKKSIRPADRRFVCVMLGLFLANAVYGVERESHWKNFVVGQPAVRVAAVQVNSMFAGAEVTLRKLSLKVDPPADLVIWPECSLGVYSEGIRNFVDYLEVYKSSRHPHCDLPRYAAPDSFLLASGRTYGADTPEDGPYRNTAFLINEAQEILGTYVKRSLLPWGEYVPGEEWFPALRGLADLDFIREAGDDPTPLVTDRGLRIGAMICYDDTAPKNARETVAAGAELLTVQVNASDYPNPVALRQHCLLAQLRGVENRRYFVRCGSTGLTCIIAPWGEILDRCAPQTEELLVASIHPLQVRTLYNRWSDWPAYVSLVALMLAALTSRIHRHAGFPFVDPPRSDTIG